MLFPLVSFPYASRILGPDGIGKVQFITTFAQYFVLIAALGIPLYGIIEVAKVKNDQEKLSKVFSELLIINLLTSLILLSVYITIICLFNWFQPDLEFYLFGCIIVFAGFSSVDWFYIGVEKVRDIALRSILIRVFSLIGLFTLVKTKNHLLIYFLIIILAIVVNNLWNLYYVLKSVKFLYKEAKLKKHLPILLALLGTTISVGIYTTMDTLLLGFLSNDTAVGYYSAAIKGTKMFIPIVAAFGIILIPAITQSIVANELGDVQKLADKSFAFTCFIAVPISFGLYIYAPEIITIFSGNEFIKAIPAMQIASPLVFLIGLGHLFGYQLLIPSNNERKYLLATIFGMSISLIFNYY